MSYVTGHPADHGQPVYSFTYRMFEALRRPGAALAGAAGSRGLSELRRRFSRPLGVVMARRRE